MLFGVIDDDAFGGEEHTCYGRGVLQCHTGYFSRINDPCFVQVLIFLRTGIIAEVCLTGTHFIHHYGTFFTGIRHDLTERFFNGTAYDLDTCLLVFVITFQAVQRLLRTDIHHAAAGYDTFFNRSTRCRKGIIYAVLLLFHLDFRSSTYVQLSHATGEFSQTLLQFLFVVGRFCSHDLCFDLSHTGCDGLFVAGTVNDRCVIFGDGDGLSRTEHLDGCLLELDTFLFADNGTTGENGDIFEHLFSAIAEARSLYGAYLQLRTKAVDNERRESFAIYIFGDDQERPSALYSGFENRKEFFEVGDLLIVDKDVRFLHLDLHSLGVRYEIRTDISAIELHTLYHIDGGIHTLGFTDGDHTVFADFTHCIRNQFADLGIIIGGNGGHLLDLIEVIPNDYGILFDLCDNSSYGFVDTAFEVERVSTRGHVLETHTHDGLRQYSSSRCSVTGLVSGLGCHFLNELCAKVFGCVFEFNLFGYRYAIFGDMRCSVFLIDDDIASLRTKCHFHCVSQLVNATLQRFPRLHIIGYILAHDY